MKWTEKSNKNFLVYFNQEYEKWAKNKNHTRYVKNIARLCNEEDFFYKKFPELFEESKKECKIGNEFLPYSERIEYLIEQFKKDLEQRYSNPGYRNTIKCAIRSFTKYIWTFFDGSCFADEYMSQMSIATSSPTDLLCQIIAGTAIMLPNVFIGKVKAKAKGDNIFANASGGLCYYRDNKNPKGSKKNQQFNVPKDGFTYPSLIADNNTRANMSLKKSILECVGLPTSLYTLFVNYTVCHIWAHPDDPRYYDNLQNLALVPSFLAGLTDHNKGIQEILRYHAYKLYGFAKYLNNHTASGPCCVVDKKSVPAKPSINLNWRVI